MALRLGPNCNPAKIPAVIFESQIATHIFLSYKRFIIMLLKFKKLSRTRSVSEAQAEHRSKAASNT